MIKNCYHPVFYPVLSIFCYFFLIPIQTHSDLIGNRFNLIPKAFLMAFPMAAGGVSEPISPTDLAP